MRMWTSIIFFFFFFSLSASTAHGFFQGLQNLGKEQGSGLSELREKLQEALPPPTSFDDVKEGDWFHTFVQSVAEWGIVSGYKNEKGIFTGNYGPGDPLSIGAILKMALKAAKVDETKCSGSPANPKAKAHWAKAYVLCGEQMDVRILRDFPDPDRPAKRGEVVGLLFDAFGESVPRGVANFTDTANHPYEADISEATKLGIVSGDMKDGVPTGTFRPNDGVNRAEAAKLIFGKLATLAQTGKSSLQKIGAKKPSSGKSSSRPLPRRSLRR
ncbi:S-layer homology domain-containing protein [Candidatus Peregrinibacteria bacterium]|nr:S-layer homology domain-containing protein [Candidatus Peregrinibacteria bacterium]